MMDWDIVNRKKKCLLFLPIGNRFEPLLPLSFGIITSKKEVKFKYWHFQVKKTFDGCRADIGIKPIVRIEDLWLGIQVKSTCKKTDRGVYDFKLNGINYDNYLILCICLEDKKMWLIPYKNITGNQSIKISAKSKYNHYEVISDNIYNKLFSINFYL